MRCGKLRRIDNDSIGRRVGFVLFVCIVDIKNRPRVVIFYVVLMWQRCVPLTRSGVG